MHPPRTPAPLALTALLQATTDVWRGGELARPRTQATGFDELDARLPGGGWPMGTLCEVAPRCPGVGELTLLLPLLRAVCHQARPVALICPPHLPYAPALVRAGLPLPLIVWIAEVRDEDARWAAEQLLRAQAGAVLLWSTTTQDRPLRRLQLAAESGASIAILFRPLSAMGTPSPAAVRLALSPDVGGIRADIVKARGGRPSSVTLPLCPA